MRMTWIDQPSGYSALTLTKSARPTIRSALTGHHFAGFSNRFWKLLYDSRLVPEPVTYVDDERLPEWGYGITNIVARPTPGIDTLRPDEYVAGRVRLRRKILRYQPIVVALVGGDVDLLLGLLLGEADLGDRALRQLQQLGAATGALAGRAGGFVDFSVADRTGWHGDANGEDEAAAAGG